MLKVIEPAPLMTLPTPAVVRVALPNVTLLGPVTRSACGPELRTRLLATGLPPLTAGMGPPKRVRVPPLATLLAPTAAPVMAGALTVGLLARATRPQATS